MATLSSIFPHFGSRQVSRMFYFRWTFFTESFFGAGRFFTTEDETIIVALIFSQTERGLKTKSIAFPILMSYWKHDCVKFHMRLEIFVFYCLIWKWSTKNLTEMRGQWRRTIRISKRYWNFPKVIESFRQFDDKSDRRLELNQSVLILMK